MQVRDGMSSVVLTVGPEHSLRDAARLMTDRHVGAAVVLDPEAPGPAIVTERASVSTTSIMRSRRASAEWRSAVRAAK